jgi:hypothetical protein
MPQVAMMKFVDKDSRQAGFAAVRVEGAVLGLVLLSRTVARSRSARGSRS